jgi:gp16 family phage-associated protein
MTTAKTQSNNIKHRLRTQHQLTLKDFADQNGFKYRDVSDVSRGIRAGNYGVGREIIEKLTSLIGPLSADAPSDKQAA